MKTNTAVSPALSVIELACNTAKHYMKWAVKHIDDQFGDGYAKAHPELVGMYIQAAARNLEVIDITKELHKISESILNRYIEE